VPPLPARVRPVLASLAGLAAVWAIGVWLTGGGTVHVGGWRLSSRSAVRPAIAALLLAGTALYGAHARSRRAALTRAGRITNRLAPWLAAMAAVAVALTAAIFGEFVAGGADSSGYLHQAQLWDADHGVMAAPVLDNGPWPQAGWDVAPLGFAPAVTPGILGPTYAPGLPWLMALGHTMAGAPGRFIWTPLAVGMLVWLTFVLARREAPAAVALGAALVVATSPPVLFAATQTMSDLLAAALWTTAVVAVGGRARAGVAVAGLAAGMALAVRPNLLPVAAGVWTAATLTAEGGLAGKMRRGVWLALPLAVAAALVAWVNLRLWGSPLASGYGATEDLFLAANVAPNLARLWQWTLDTRAWWTLAAVPAVAALATTTPPARAWPAIALVGAILVSYLPYAVFAEWWYLRFYLPAWPVLAAASLVLAWRLLHRASPEAAPLVAFALAVAIAGSALRFTVAADVFDLWRGAQRYPAVATWVRDNAPANAVVWSMQHSGSLAAHGAAAVARWDHIAPEALDTRVAALAARGRTSWVVLDDWEEATWRQRFAGQVRGRLDWAPLAEARVGTTRVHVFDLTAPTRAVAPALIRVVHGGPWPPARQPAPRSSK
jgi:hypothetical protein